MKLNQLAGREGSRKNRMRVGRGIGSGKGKTGGRGVKGQKARAGVAIKGFEGGQMPLHRRLPKRGFTNIFRKDFAEVSLGRIQEAIDSGLLDAAQTINAESLQAAGVIRRAKDGVRILGGGELTSAVTLDVAGASRPAMEAVGRAGGTITVKAARTAETEG